MRKVMECIGWVSQQGCTLAEPAAIELAETIGMQAVWKDLGSYGEIIEFRRLLTTAAHGRGWEVQTKDGPIWNKADSSKVLRENVFGVVVEAVKQE